MPPRHRGIVDASCSEGWLLHIDGSNQAQNRGSRPSKENTGGPAVGAELLRWPLDTAIALGDPGYAHDKGCDTRFSSRPGRALANRKPAQGACAPSERTLACCIAQPEMIPTKQSCLVPQNLRRPNQRPLEKNRGWLARSGL